MGCWEAMGTLAQIHCGPSFTKDALLALPQRRLYPVRKKELGVIAKLGARRRERVLAAGGAAWPPTSPTAQRRGAEQSMPPASRASLVA